MHVLILILVAMVVVIYFATRKSTDAGDQHLATPARLEPAELSGFDAAFHDATQAALQEHGFSYLADFDLPRLTRALPDARAFVRGLSSEDGSVAAMIYQIGGEKVVQRAARVIELRTELDDGTALVTTNTDDPDLPSALARVLDARYAKLDRFRAPPDVDPAVLLGIHKQRVSAKLSGEEPVATRRVKSWPDLVGSLERDAERKRTPPPHEPLDQPSAAAE